MRSWKWVVMGAVAVVGLLLVAPWTSCAASVGGDGPATAVADRDVAASDAVADAGSEAEEEADATVIEVQVEVVEPEAAVPTEEADADPQTLAEKFVAAGGQKLCLAMVAQLNPDWKMDACKVIDDEARKEACENQRRPLLKFAEDVCRTVIEESLRLDLDPGLVLAVIERESSFGRAMWDQRERAYEVQTDVCHLTLPKSRIVERQPGRRAGTELMTWTYGPQAPVAGSVARNRQPVIVESEDDDQVVLNTCAAGERGIMQTTTRELRIGGDAIGMTGSTAERGRALEANPMLQVRLGCQALSEHRGLMPPEQQHPWWAYIGTYNTGSLVRGEHWCRYTRKIMRHYLQACEGYMAGNNGPASFVDVKDVWSGCVEVRTAYDNWQFCEQYRDD